MKPKNLIVVGGGAAGFFTAINAVALNPGLKVTILEKGSKLLSKVRISGGGRCNVTHACSSISEMSAAYPRGQAFLKKAFRHFFTNDTIDWFAKRGVRLKTEADGRMFPVTDDSQTIINCFIQEANKLGIKILLNRPVERIAFAEGLWNLHTASEKFSADFVCITTGGHPKSSGYDWLSGTGLAIVPPVPSLFTFNIPNDPATSLMGLSVPNASVKIVGRKPTSSGPLLITHWGLSGPAVLKLSSLEALFCNEQDYRFSILVNWNADFSEANALQLFQEHQRSSKQKIKNDCPLALPARLWEHLLLRSEINPDLHWHETWAKALNKLVKNCCTLELQVSGKTTFKEEFVTAGGVSLNDIEVGTMQSKNYPGLYFAGEVLDIDGITGGYNFQNAWTTGYIAARSIASTAADY